MSDYGEATFLGSTRITGTNVEVEELPHPWRGISIPILEPPIQKLVKASGHRSEFSVTATDGSRLLTH